MVQSSGRFKTTHTGCYLIAKAYGEVRRFETALYGAFFRRQSKKRYLHALFSHRFLWRTGFPIRNGLTLKRDGDERAFLYINEF
jgi:hypothetical protein